jgi:CRISPR/Cas system CMR subunit Cmr4 (Cas7 group RAMP superfamily)
MIPEEQAAAEAAKAQQDEAAQSAAKVTEPPVEEPFDKERAMATITKLRETEKQAKAERKELEQLKAEKKQRDDAALTESERNKKERDELAAENAKIKTDLLRRDVISETGLPAIFADRLKGNTKEEMLADAEELAKTLPTLKTAPKLPATNPGNAQTSETDAQKRERIFGKQTNVFDSDAIRQAGGGVIWKK